MRMTTQTWQVYAENKMKNFLIRGRTFLQKYFGDLIRERGISDQSLELAVRQSYQWADDNGFAGESRAMKVACARLCFGTFFMEDPKFTELTNILIAHFEQPVSVREDPIRDYLFEHKKDWQTDWFTEHLPLTWKLCAARNVIPHTAPEWPTAGGIFYQMFDVERRSSFLLPENAREGIFQQLMKSASVAVTTGGDEQVQLLLAIAQYYDGFRCFDDPLRPRWYGMLASENRPHLPWRLQELFTPGKQQDKHYEQSRSA